MAGHKRAERGAKADRPGFNAEAQRGKGGIGCFAWNLGTQETRIARINTNSERLLNNRKEHRMGTEILFGIQEIRKLGKEFLSEDHADLRRLNLLGEPLLFSFRWFWLGLLVTDALQ